MNTYKTILTVCLLTSLACRQTYTPPAVANPPNYLVVEGFIDTNPGDTTMFTLSRTIKLDTNTHVPESGATVTVEGTDNSSFPLIEMSGGKYRAPLNTLNYNNSYRLHIKTTLGKEYASDYVPLVATPPIDSISWKRLETDVHQGIQIYANTHDPQNKTHYYRWDYTETWQFDMPYHAVIKFIPGTGIVPYSPNTISTCWKNDSAASILLGTSTQLSQDLIFEAPLVLVPLGSQQISVRYSVLVTQYSLTKEAFNWWQILQKNTEQIGSIFGVQPSANQGNLHCLTDAAELVLGFVSGGGVRSQRIFITKDQVLPWNYNNNCSDTPVAGDLKTLTEWYTAGYLPWTFGLNNSVMMSSATCVDCTITGSNHRPLFW
jgi:hypothetical protein